MKRVIILLLCLGFTFLQSCTKQPEGAYGIDSANETTITFGLKLPRSSTPTSRAGSFAKDVKIENITILVFDNTESEKRCLYSRNGHITQTATGVTFTTNLEITDRSVTIHIFANVGAMGNYTGRPEEDVIKELTTTIDLNNITTIALPMHGKLHLDNVEITTTVATAVPLLRSVARVDIIDNADNPNFVLEGVMAYFTPNKGRLVQDATSGEGNVTLPTMPENPITITTPIVLSVGGADITNQLFIYENLNTNGAGKSTRIVVQGKYNNGVGDKSYYYPVDFKKSNTLSNILRNYIYTFTINSVSGAGYETAEDASKGVAVNIDVTIIDWSDGVLDEIIFDGANYFSIESKTVELYGDQGVLASLLAKSNIPFSEWKMGWSDDEAIKPTCTQDIDVSCNEFKVTKSVDGLEFVSLVGHTIDVTKVLHIEVTNRLRLTVTVKLLDAFVLSVDGNTSHFETSLYHEGEIFFYEVLTGSPFVNWTARHEGFITGAPKYNPGGSHGGSLAVSFVPNNAETAKTGKITLERDAEDAKSPIEIGFTQEASPTLTLGTQLPISFSSGDQPNRFTINIGNVDEREKYIWKATRIFTNIISGVTENEILNIASSYVNSPNDGKTATGVDGDILTINAPSHTKLAAYGGEIIITLVRKITQKDIVTDKVKHDFVVQRKYNVKPNCYIIAPNSGGSVTIPINNINIFWGGNGEGTASYNAKNVLDQAAFIPENMIWDNSYDVRVLWNTVAGATPTCSGKTVSEFTMTGLTNATSQGSVLVGVFRDGESTECLWSWHLWVTNAVPIEVNMYYNTNAEEGAATNYVWMLDRDLGDTHEINNFSAKSLYYQWGRKDPLRVGVATNSAGYHFDKTYSPQTFFSNNSTSMTVDIPKDHARHWTGGLALYNPCPEGYKLPQADMQRSSMQWKEDENEWRSKLQQGVWNAGYTGGVSQCWAYTGTRTAPLNQNLVTSNYSLKGDGSSTAIAERLCDGVNCTDGGCQSFASADQNENGTWRLTFRVTNEPGMEWGTLTYTPSSLGPVNTFLGCYRCEHRGVVPPHYLGQSIGAWWDACPLNCGEPGPVYIIEFTGQDQIPESWSGRKLGTTTSVLKHNKGMNAIKVRCVKI